MRMSYYAVGTTVLFFDTQSSRYYKIHLQTDWNSEKKFLDVYDTIS